MPIQHAVLALLAASGPSYGYQLRNDFKQAVGPQWGDLNVGHLYQVLDRLVRDGLVTRREVEQRRRPDKVVYRLTKQGQQELDDWLERPFVRQGGYRDDFFLKLFAASRLGPDQLATVLQGQRTAYLAELASLAELRKQHRDDSLVDLLLEAAILHTEANLRVVEHAEKNAPKLAEASVTRAAAAPESRAESA
jgi:DNA-binding PadR family transcriptional regulator